MVSRTHNLTQTHALFLEWHSLQAIRAAGRFTDENGNGGSRPHTPPPMEADCLEMFDTGRTLLATLGFSLFDPVASAGEAGQAPEVFVCEASGAKGRGQYTEEGFVVLQGSVGRLQSVPSIQGTSDDNFRQRLLEQGVMRAEGDTVVFQSDHLFRSPSMAALGSSAVILMLIFPFPPLIIRLSSPVKFIISIKENPSALVLLPIPIAEN